MTIGSRIKTRRQELKMSQREMATRLGYTDHSTLARIETNKADLTLSRLLKIAEVLGVTPSYIIEGEHEDMKSLTTALILNDPSLSKLVKNYVTLDESDRATVVALVSSLAKKNKNPLE